MPGPGPCRCSDKAYRVKPPDSAKPGAGSSLLLIRAFPLATPWSGNKGPLLQLLRLPATARKEAAVMRMWHPATPSVKESDAGDCSKYCGLIENSVSRIPHM